MAYRGTRDFGQFMGLARYSGPARGALALLLSVTAATRSALARIKADGSAIDLLPSLLRFEAFPHFIDMGEVCELEQRSAQD